MTNYLSKNFSATSIKKNGAYAQYFFKFSIQDIVFAFSEIGCFLKNKNLLVNGDKFYLTVSGVGKDKTPHLTAYQTVCSKVWYSLFVGILLHPEYKKIEEITNAVLSILKNEGGLDTLLAYKLKPCVEEKFPPVSNVDNILYIKSLETQNKKLRKELEAVYEKLKFIRNISSQETNL